MVGTLGVLGALGVRTYRLNAKSSEVRNALAQIAQNASIAYEREDPVPGLAEPTAAATGRVCPAASLPVPAQASAISGKRYQSSRAEWEVDKARNAGFSCLRFELSAPQKYQYRYEATPSSFLAGGRGDLDGDGRFSDFTLQGRVEAGRLLLSPQFSETDPEE
jgi:hypothetical protein